jgi:hypothetical protein
MSTIYPYNQVTQSDWLNQINDQTIDNCIDYFFTQRRITEVEDIIDDKTLERKKKKIQCIYNFLAINFPSTLFKNCQHLIIDIEIWGDEKFNFSGSITKTNGEIPHLMLKLKDDKNIFIKLIFRDNDKMIKTYISFIPVIKRYQMTPEQTVDC